jgi:hypothetical protein
METAPRHHGALLLPAFLRHSANMKMPLTGPGMVVLAHIAFQEVKAAFRARFATRADAEEWELTAEDCNLVRETFEFERFDAYTFPSADLQLSAASPRRSAVATTNGSSASYIRRPRSCITGGIGAARTRRRFLVRWRNRRVGCRVFTSDSSRPISPRTPPCACSTRCRS